MLMSISFSTRKDLYQRVLVPLGQQKEWKLWISFCGDILLLLLNGASQIKTLTDASVFGSEGKYSQIKSCPAINIRPISILRKIQNVISQESTLTIMNGKVQHDACQQRAILKVVNQKITGRPFRLTSKSRREKGLHLETIVCFFQIVVLQFRCISKLFTGACLLH